MTGKNDRASVLLMMDQFMISATPIFHLLQSIIPNIPPPQLGNSGSIRSPPLPSINHALEKSSTRAAEEQEKSRSTAGEDEKKMRRR